MIIKEVSCLRNGQSATRSRIYGELLGGYCVRVTLQSAIKCNNADIALIPESQMPLETI